ncbi:thiol:disulfide interchange protein DsbC [Gammaproteobacteria bacterium]|nr:thiol:disulfide interchange protein DsbC [Gammaproteobacteria bacterium]
MKKLFTLSALLCFTGLSFALPPTKYLSDAIGGDKIETPTATPVAGIYETSVKGQIIYLSEDGKYAIQGTMVNLETGDNISEQRLNTVRKNLIQTIPVSEMIIYKPTKTKDIIYVYTDIDCGYCRKLHHEMQSYLDKNIEVRYLAFPRSGPNTISSRKYDAVWCSKDRHTAMTDAKNGKDIPAGNCKTPVEAQFRLGMEMGVNGTPAIILEDGYLIAGYVPAADLRTILDEHKNVNSAKGSEQVSEKIEPKQDLK